MGLLEWSDCDQPTISSRYDRIAHYYGFFEWLFLLPAGIRERAVNALELKHGDRVLEIGCGSGKNLKILREAVGPEGCVYGVDLSEGMLSRAEALRETQNWRNVTLIRSDAAKYNAPEPLDGVIFSLSYSTMPHHKEVLSHAWNQLRPGKSLVIMDSKLPPGVRGKLIVPFAVSVSKLTVLGNPHIRPWEELAGLTQDFQMEELFLQTYYVCRGRKPAKAPPSAIATDGLR